MKSKNFTHQLNFEPTPAMRVWLDKSIELETDDISKIALSCKVSRQSWYIWSKDPNFVQWFNSQWRDRIGQFGWRLDVIGLTKAKNNYSYWRAMQERIGNLPIKSTLDDQEIRVQIVDYGADSIVETSR
jgi:hypothetical protein